MSSTTSFVGPEGFPVAVVFEEQVQEWPVAEAEGFWSPTAEQRALARELSLADLAEDLGAAARADAEGWDRSLVWERELESVDELVVALSGPAAAMDLVLLASIAPAELESAGARIAYLQCLDRVSGLTAALRAQVLVEIAGPVATGDHLLESSLEHEVAVARRSSRYGSGRSIENARALGSTFPGFAAALRVGEVSEAHVSMLVDRTRAVTDPAVLTAVEKRVLPKARRLPVGKFGDEVAAAVVDLDPDAVTRHRRAREQRTVYSRRLEDGLGFLGVVDEWGVIAAIQATIDTDAEALRAQRGGAAAVADGEDEARMDACRADALAARVLGQVAEDGTVTWDPRESVQVTLDLVIDLDTLRGEADRMATLEGQPVPAQIAREHADTVRTWRRVVTDPADGHLLDYGTRQYLPDKLRRYILARDGGCTAPHCTTRSPRRLQMDHALPYPAGPSSTSNCGTLCVTCHQLKTTGHLQITDSDADGSRTWTTRLGQSVHIPPRPFLHDPRDHREHHAADPPGPPGPPGPRGPQDPAPPPATRPAPPASPGTDTPPF
jgi:hypothetical protein